MSIVFGIILAKDQGTLGFTRKYASRMGGISKNPPRSGRAMHQDSAAIIFNQNRYLLTVADGIAGAKQGELASAEAVLTLANLFVNSTVFGQSFLINSILQAQRNIWASQEKNGTTIEACVIEQDQLIAAHLGDSRLYLVRDDEIRLLFPDQTLATEFFSIRRRAFGLSNKNLLGEYYQYTASGESAQILVDYAGKRDLSFKIDKQAVLELCPELREYFNLFFRRCLRNPLKHNFLPTFEEKFKALKIDEKQKDALLNLYMRTVFSVPQTFTCRLQPGDVLIMCSDGLNYLAWSDFESLGLQLAKNSKENYQDPKHSMVDEVTKLYEAVANPMDNITILGYLHL
ncbi:MAG: protein phosphatase 2C domain-containing protein [bacterium]|nr:protein phosphatase 2C domain-containing protein [Candidatus Margulisiibacteriota bacterium]